MKPRLLAALAATFLLATTACTSDDKPAANGAVQIELMAVGAADTVIPTIVQTLMDGYAANHPGSSLKLTVVPQDQVEQQLQLLSAQDALPEMFIGPGTPAGQKDMATSGKALNIEEALTALGVLDKLDPTAAQIMRNQQGGTVYALPFELNIEGFWYNKKIFSDIGVTPPATWDALVSAASTLQGKGIQPFSGSGIQGWPLTRLVSGYLYRSLGAEALQKVADGKAKLTDASYVKAAQAVQDLGKAGYFGKGFASLDYGPAEDEFLLGKSAMFYMGSWAIGDYNDPARNKIGGPDNVGFFPFPSVSGGSGGIDQTPMNAGQPFMISAKKYKDNPALAEWLKYLVENFGNVSLAKRGAISGFVAAQKPSTLPSTTVLVANQIAASKQPVQWFEALMPQKAQQVAQTNAAGLVNGSLSAADFMAKVQEALTA